MSNSAPVARAQSEVLSPQRHARQAVLATLALYFAYALARMVVPAGEGFWSFALVLGFYVLPAQLLRNSPELAHQAQVGPEVRLPPFDARAVLAGLACAALTFPLFAAAFWGFYADTCGQGETGWLSPIVWLENWTPLDGKLEKLVHTLCRHHDGTFLPSQWNFPETWTKLGGLGFVEQVLLGLFAVALPEEIFHRGYLMSALERRWPARFRLFGVPFGAAVFFSSLLFAAGHLVSLQQTSRLATFFPALVFAWLWRRTGSLWAPTVYHLACNLLMDFLLATTFHSK